MKNPAVRVVLMPRYTPLYGATTFYSPPINVKAFEKVILTVWKGNGIGSTPADVDEFDLQQSADLGIWNSILPAFTPASPNSELVTTKDLDLEWARLAVTVSGASPGISVWAIGTFVPRAGGGQASG
jgi:hypothetical protein